MPLTQKQYNRLEKIRESGRGERWKVPFREYLSSCQGLTEEELSTLNEMLDHDYKGCLCCQDKDFNCYVYTLSPEGQEAFADEEEHWRWPESSAHAMGLIHEQK